MKLMHVLNAVIEKKYLQGIEFVNNCKRDNYALGAKNLT
jgi:hypothetical protein